MNENDLLWCVSLPVELTNGNNGQGRGWRQTHYFRKKAQKLIACLGLLRKPFEQPVQVKVVRLFGKGKRKWDDSSVLRGNYKQLEDAMVACGWFHDDSPKWITRTIAEQVKSKDGKDSVEIWIYRSGQ